MCGDRGEGLRGFPSRLAALYQGRRCLVPIRSYLAANGSSG
jgi:hypothetical protein